MWEWLAHFWHDVWLALVLAVIFAIVVDIMQVGARFRRLIGATEAEANTMAVGASATHGGTVSFPKIKKKSSGERREFLIVVAVVWSVVLTILLIATGRMHEFVCGNGTTGEGWFCSILPHRQRELPRDIGFNRKILEKGKEKSSCVMLDPDTMDCTLTGGGFSDLVSLPKDWGSCAMAYPATPGNIKEKDWWIAFQLQDGKTYGPYKTDGGWTFPSDEPVRLQGHGYVLFKRKDCG